MTDLAGKVAVITGASSGIGEATAKRLAAEKVKVALVARRKQKLQQVQKDIEKAGGTAIIIEADVTKRDVCDQVIKEVNKELGAIHILVNNAGIMLNGPVHDSPIDDWEQMIHLNLLGLLYMTRAALPSLKEAKGHLVNLSSVAGRTTRPGSAVYNATKWGVNGFTDALRQELVEEKTGVRTTLIEPGVVDTELQTHLRPEVMKNWQKNFGDMTVLEPEDIAEAIYFAVSRPPHVSVNEILVRPTEQGG